MQYQGKIYPLFVEHFYREETSLSREQKTEWPFTESRVA